MRSAMWISSGVPGILADIEPENQHAVRDGNTEIYSSLRADSKIADPWSKDSRRTDG